MEKENTLRAKALQRIVREESRQRERIINHYRFAIFTLIGLAEWWGRSGHDHDHLTMMPFIFMAWGIAIGLLNFTVLKKYFKQWLPAAITTLDVTVLVVSIRIIYTHAIQFDEPALREIDRALMGLIVLLSVNVIRFSWKITLWSGFCAIVSLVDLRIYSGSLGSSAILTDLLVISVVVGLLMYANITFRRVTERLLIDLRLVQERRLAELRALVAGVTHEMNSPLGTISGNAQVSLRAVEKLQESFKEVGEKVRQALVAIEQVTESNQVAIHRISSIVQILGDYSRVDDAEEKRVDLGEGLDSCLELLSEEIGDRIEILREYTNLPPTYCRPAQLNQVFMHLLKNAIQSIDGPGKIVITGKRENDDVVIAISDNGCGISEKRLAGIFDLQISRRGERMGMGLGLPISRSIMQDHDGTITIDSEADIGTTVILRLPIR